MTTEARPKRRLFARDQPDEHRLAFLDQTALELLRVTGRGQLMQAVWVYEHPLDMDGLNRFNDNLYKSLGSRLIERSPLPFGRPRWVRTVGPPPPIHFADRPRPRTELMDWADRLGQLPIDPERGPGWHLAVQPLDDGSTAVSIVASHNIADGVGALMAVFEAVTGMLRDPGYDELGSRSLSEALVADARQAVRDLPLTARTAVKAVKMVRAQRDQFKNARAAHAAEGDPTEIFLPSVALYIDIPEWDAKAQSLGGNSYSLLAGFTARLGERFGRNRPSDGAVSLMMAINLRESLDDDRAIAMAFSNAAVDPAKVTIDLTEARDAVREGREKAKNEPDQVIELMALVPWLPRSAVKGIAELLFSYAEDPPCTCSNLGDLPPDLARPDGTPAENMFIRALDTSVTLGDLERSRGQLVVVSGRINGKVSISVEAYQLGAENSKERLRAVVAETLAEFGLTAVVD